MFDLRLWAVIDRRYNLLPHDEFVSCVAAWVIPRLQSHQSFRAFFETQRGFIGRAHRILNGQQCCEDLRFRFIQNLYDWPDGVEPFDNVAAGGQDDVPWNDDRLVNAEDCLEIQIIGPRG